MRPRIELRPADVTVICDNREQKPFTLDPLKMIRGTLPTGDYSVLGLERFIAVERKETQDLIGCIGRERDRFEREIQRLLAHETRAIVVEGHWSQIEMRQYRGDVHPNAVIGSVMDWVARGVPVLFCGDRARAQQFTARLLFIAARRRFRELQTFLPALRVIGDANDGEQEFSDPPRQPRARPRAAKDAKRRVGDDAECRDD